MGPGQSLMKDLLWSSDKYDMDSF